MFESHGNRTESDVILCPAISDCDITNKGGMCGKSVHYITSQPFSALHQLEECE